MVSRLFFTRFVVLIVLALAAGIPASGKVTASEFSVNSEADFNTALSTAATGDTIILESDIVITSTKTVTTGITIDGNGYTLTVPEPGLTSAGTFNASASSFNALTISASGQTVTLRDVTVIGGSSSTQGNGVRLTAGTLVGDGLVITQSRGTSGGGGLVVSSGAKAHLIDSVIYRNSGRYGGGFLNQGLLILERSTLSENRSEASNGGGGAGENKSAGVLYILNSTFSNNQSTEIGGAINNYQATMYVASSTFTGNVAYGSYGGGAIGQNGGSVTVVSSLFAYNYKRTGGSVSAPTSFELDDLQPYNGTPTVHYSFLHRDNPSINGSNNVDYDGALDGSNDTLFAGGTTGLITNGDGDGIGSAEIYRPAMVQDGSLRASPLADPTALSDAGNRGTDVRYDTDLVSPGLSYLNRTATPAAWVDLTGITTESDVLATDQFGNSRNDPPYAGAVEQKSAPLGTVVVKKAANGSVSGGSIYGDSYPLGTEVTLVALPDSGYTLNEWQDGAGGQVSTAGVLKLTVNSDVTLEPSFTPVQSGFYQVTYVGNGADNEAPDPDNTNTATTIKASGAMTRSGYDFVEWNTRPNGSGTAYQPNDAYDPSPVSSLTLYAQWAPTVATAPATPSAPTVTNSDNDVSVSWSAPDDGGSAITGYLIETSNDGGTTWATAGGTCSSATSSNATTCTIADITRGTDLSVRVTAINVIGSSSASSASQVSIPTTTTSTTTSTTMVATTTSTTVATTPTTQASDIPSTTSTSAPPITVTPEMVEQFPEGQLTIVGQPIAGESITINGSDLLPNTPVDIYIFSEPRFLGTSETDGEGRFSLQVSLPIDLEGSHTIALVQYNPESDSPSGVRLTIEVSSASLPATGSNSGQVAIFIAALSVGLMTILMTRRRITT